MTRPALAERIRHGDPLPLPLDILLRTGEPFQRIGMWWRKQLPKTRVAARVVSIGNLTAGGTGKTPAVIARAADEIETGKKVAVLTRGYGAPTGTQAFDSTRLGTATPYEALGDEGALILARVPGTIVIKNPDRIAGARVAIDRHGCDMLILDDGFQYLRLERDEDIVLIDATNPFGNGRLVPRGILREPVGALVRATEIVLTRTDRADDLDSLRDCLRQTAPSVPVRMTRHVPTGYRHLADGSVENNSHFRNTEVDIACAIGNPGAFAATVKQTGAMVVEQFVFPDHRAFSLDAWSRTRPLVMTEKDAARTVSAPANVWALEIALAASP